MLVAPKLGRPLKLYVSVSEESISCLLAQDSSKGHERAIFYLSRILNDAKCNYPFIRNYV